MKKIITLFLACFLSGAFSQNMQVQNMLNYLRNKDYEKAKVAADAAAEHESTKNSAKMWMYRGNVYKAIFSDTSKKVRAIDSEAEEKSLEAYLNCLKNDKNTIYKDTVKGPLVMVTAATRNKANYYKVNKEFNKALRCFDLLEASIPYDFDGGIKRNNITKEKIIFSRFEVYQAAGDKEKVKQIANQLIDMKYKEPRIYTDMVRMALQNKDTADALSYIEKGKTMFEDNMDLITWELDIYLARKKTDVLIDKLTKAIELAPDNELLHFILAISYDKTKKRAEAEKEYLKALELKPDYEAANYNLGVLYYNYAKEWNDKLNALPVKDPKTTEYETKTNDYFKKAVGYFENSYEATKDAKTKKLIWQLYARLGDKEKAEKYK